MKFFVDQFGAMSLDELTALLEGYIEDGERRMGRAHAAWMADFASSRKGGQRERDAIRDIFECGQRVAFRRGERGGAEFYAAYLPRCESASEWGIYVDFPNCAEALSGGLEAYTREFVEQLFAHEMAHCFVEELLGPEEEGRHLRSRGASCRFEEALANKLALLAMAKGGREGCSEAIEPLLYKTLEEGGLPGYGEYGKVTDSMIASIREIVSTGGCQGFPSLSCPRSDRGEARKAWFSFHEERGPSVPLYAYADARGSAIASPRLL